MGLFDGIKYDMTLSIEGSGRTDYKFETVGKIHGEEVDGHDNINEEDGVATGHVNGGRDLYSISNVPKGVKFTGEVGDYTIKLNGEPIDPFNLNMRTIRIETTADKAPYRFAVDADGRIIGGQYTNETEIIHESGTSARGRVSGSGHDEWYFAGALTAWPDSNQPLKVTVDGKVYEYEGNPPNGVV